MMVMFTELTTLLVALQLNQNESFNSALSARCNVFQDDDWQKPIASHSCVRASGRITSMQPSNSCSKYWKPGKTSFSDSSRRLHHT